MPPKLSSEEKPQYHPDFDKCVQRLARTIGFEDIERLSILMRSSIEWVLKELNSQPKKEIKGNELTFQAEDCAGLVEEFELDFFRSAEEADGPIGTIRFKDGHYMGVPNNRPKTKPQESSKPPRPLSRAELLAALPQLVERRLIFFTGFRKGGNGNWSKIDLGNGASDLRLDFQINGSKDKKK
jgi:hypothetical protein